MQFIQANSRSSRWITYMLIGYPVIIILTITLLSVLSANKTNDVLKTKVSAMCSALNEQMKMNMNSRLSKIETTGTLIFSDKNVYTYDATDDSVDEYDAVSIEKEISDTLFDICIMDNFVDFGIVYANGHAIGKISNATKNAYGDRMYAELSDTITRPRTEDGWSTGYQDDYKRIYYVKRIHENAIFVSSFYTRELESVFDHPGGIEDITVRLLTNNNIIIYSSGEDEVGSLLQEDLRERVGFLSETSIDDSYLVTVNPCGDSWRVLCSVPTEIIMKEKNDVQMFILIICIFLAVVAVILSMILSVAIFAPVHSMVNMLRIKADIDQLTGVCNKHAFEEYIETTLEERQRKETPFAVILLDIDNFKGVNDTLGHAYGDKVLTGVGEILRSTFGEQDCVGRIGGDEFCVCLNLEKFKNTDYMPYISEKCSLLCEAFHKNYTGDNGDYKISASIGVSVFPEHGDHFMKLYKHADTALYYSKKHGKDTYTVFKEGM